VENIAPTGIRSLDCQGRSKSLYRLSYPAFFTLEMLSSFMVQALKWTDISERIFLENYKFDKHYVQTFTDEIHSVQ